MEKCWGQWRESQYFLYRLTTKFIIRFLQLHQLGQLSKNIKSMECGRVFWLFSISTAFISSTSSQSYNSLSKMYIFKLPPQKKKKYIYIYIYIIFLKELASSSLSRISLKGLNSIFKLFFKMDILSQCI